MKIVDIAICDDNNDPKGLGRIRYKLYASPTAEKEKSIEYKPWDSKDPFVANPFLPLNINFVPEIGQAVKIIVYDTRNETVNQEYIAGPFSTSHDFNSQTFSDQVQNTTYGATTKQTPDIKSSEGKYYKKSEGSLAKNNHYGVYGKYGSDLIFTDNGLILRGGKLVSKDSLSPQKRVDAISYPIVSEKFSNLYLKKFPKTMTLKEEKVTNSVVANTILKYIVEYDVDDLASPNLINVYAYKVKSQPYGSNLYNSNKFNEYTELNKDPNFINLINLNGNSGSTPTFTFSATSISDAVKEIKNVLFTIDSDNLQGMSTDNKSYKLYSSEDIHPFYFRPTTEFLNRTSNIDEKLNVIKNVKLRNKSTHGLIWSSTQPNPPITKNEEKKSIPNINQNSTEQTFGSIVSDNIYLLSTNTNQADKSIHFNELDKYEFTQVDYVEKIAPNTYSTIRGENLIRLLRSIIEVLITHKHNINKTYAQNGFDAHQRLIKLVEQMENDLLNTSIRIN